MPRVEPESARGKTELVPLWQHDVGDYLSAAEISPDGRLCIAGAGNGVLVGLDLETGERRFRMHAHDDGVLALSIAPDSTRFVTCGHTQTAKVWSASGELLFELPGGGPAWVERVAWAPLGARIATGAGRIVRIWSAGGSLLAEPEPLASTVSGLVWRADGTAVAASAYGGVRIIPVVDSAKARTLAWKGSLISLAWSPDGKVIACGSQDSSVHFWRLGNGKDSEMSGYPFKPKALAWDGESKLLATSGDAAVTVWDFRGKGPEGTKPIQLAGHKSVSTRLAFSPRKGVLASGAQDMSVLIWEPRRSVKPIGFAFLEDEVTALVWHPEHRGLLGGDASGNLVYWKGN